MNLKTHIHNFLSKRCDPSQPILIGLSGGPDSLCLFHLLLETPLKLHIAHIDHRWREESAAEAEQLKSLAEKHQIPFHLKVLDPTKLSGNLEAASRQERLSFFSEICRQHGCQGVFLGHHADDQAETVLKRVLEGGSVMRLAALQEESFIDGLRVLRPFLSISKQTLLDWLSQHQIQAFEDSTNLDTKFLRGKFRTRLIPLLNDEFGKKVSAPLCHLGQEVSELCRYFDNKVAPYLKQTVSSKMGLYLDLSNQCPDESVEIKYLVRKFCEQGNFLITSSLAEETALTIQSGTANKELGMGNHKLYIDRKKIFLPSFETDFPQLQNPISLVPGEYQYNNWIVRIEECDRQDSIKKTSWKDVWNGQCLMVVPKKELTLGHPAPSASYKGRKKTLAEWWTDHKVPAFLRNQFPVIWDQNIVYDEFLSGASSPDPISTQEWLKIEVIIKN